MRVAILGGAGGTNVGDSLRRAALAQGHDVRFFDTAEAEHGSRLLRTLAWRFNDRRPVRLARFSAGLVEACAAWTPEILITTGRAPLAAEALQQLRDLGIVLANYSTDDPWNPTSGARWFLHALKRYDLVFSPRRSNLEELRRLGGPAVHYLPFAYDETLVASAAAAAPADGPDILFVGGADRTRAAFVAEFVANGPEITLVGDYWERHAATRGRSLGHLKPDQVQALTLAAKINLCLVRRLNRDGHVMRSFEIAASGACMLAEDTDEHREIFGPDGDCVRYFASASQAGALASGLLQDDRERLRLSARLREHILRGRHSYGDRLETMLERAFGPATPVRGRIAG